MVKRNKGSKLHLAVDTLGHLLVLHVTPASADDRAEVERLTQAVRASTCQSVESKVVKLPEAKRGFVLRPAALGRRAVLRLGDPLPPTDEGL